MKKLSLSITILLNTFFSSHLFATNLHDDQKEGFSTPTHPLVATPKQITVRDYTILNHKNINHTLQDIEEVDDDLRDNVWAINQKLIKSNNQSPPLLLGAVLRHEKTNEYHQYLIADTGLLCKSTQPNAVKRAHRKGFHLIQATPGHVSLQLLEWLQISKYYSVTALHTNRPVCRNCYLIANSLWKKELSTNEKGCLGLSFPLLDKMPILAQRYINTHLNLSLVQNLVVPMMGYVSKEEMNKAKQKNKEMASFVASMQELNNTQIAILSKQVKAKNKQIQIITNELNNKSQLIETLSNQLNDKSQQLKKKEDQLEEKDENINMLNEEVNKKDNQLNDKNTTISSLNNVIKENQQKIAELQNILQEIPKQPLDDKANKELFEAIESNNVKEVKIFLYAYKDVVTARNEYKRTPFLCAVEKGHLEIAKVLKERGAYVHAKTSGGNNALHLACRYSGSIEMVTWLLDVCKMGIETKGNEKTTPFLFAAEGGQLGIAKLLKDRGADIHAKNEYKNNALHFACWLSGSIEMVTWLVDECKIGLESKEYAQKTPFLFAVERRHPAIAKLLRQRGANVNEKDEDGDNALHLACYSDSVEMVEWLLDKCKIGIESKGKDQSTPFLCAVKGGKKKKNVSWGR